MNGHYDWYQEEWSNQGHTCLQRLTNLEPKPRATFTVKAGSGTGHVLNFDATGSSASGGVAYYVWQFNDAFGADTVEVTTPTISHAFPAVGSYSVGLTIYGADGVSTGAGGIVSTGHNGFNPGFPLSTRTPAVGQSVHFAPLDEVSAGAVVVELGDCGARRTQRGTEWGLLEK